MKIICLNIWGGILFEPLMQFIKGQSASTDVFCFQEVLKGPERIDIFKRVRTNIYTDLERALPDFRQYAHPIQGISVEGRELPGLSVNISMFVRSTYAVESEGGFFARGSWRVLDYKNAKDTPGFAQYVTLRTSTGDVYTVVNVHGIAAWPKTDTPARLEQSRRIREFVDSAPGKKILCGDFNLFPDTESVARLACGMRNLTQEFDIPTTRSKEHFAVYGGPQPGGYTETISDYCFVSPDVNVVSFSVPEIAVSDHFPLVLEVKEDQPITVSR